jgi:transcriptional regulator with XRE-family HTH domain
VSHTLSPVADLHPLDSHIGSRLRLRRNILGLSQERLAESLGLTFQQVQKYERGSNRISASRLYAISKLLNVPFGFFFEDMGEYSLPSAENVTLHENANPDYDADPMARQETLELVRNYYRLDASERASVRNLIATLAGKTPEIVRAG